MLRIGELIFGKNLRLKNRFWALSTSAKGYQNSFISKQYSYELENNSLELLLV